MNDLIIRFLAGVVIVTGILIFCLIRVCCNDDIEEEETHDITNGDDGEYGFCVCRNQETPIDTKVSRGRRYQHPVDPEDLSSPPVTIHLLSEFMNIHQKLISPILPLMVFAERETPSTSSPRDQRKVRFQGSEVGQEESVQMSNYTETSFTTYESQVEVHSSPIRSPLEAVVLDEVVVSDEKVAKKEIEMSDSPESLAVAKVIVHAPPKRPPLKRGYSLLSKRRSLGDERDDVLTGVVQMSLKAKLRRIQMYGKDHAFYARSVDNILVWVHKNDFDYETLQWKLFWEEELKNEPVVNKSPHQIVHSDSFLSFSSETDVSENYKERLNENGQPNVFDEQKLRKQHASEVLV